MVHSVDLRKRYVGRRFGGPCQRGERYDDEALKCRL